MSLIRSSLRVNNNLHYATVKCAIMRNFHTICEYANYTDRQVTPIVE